MPWHNRGYPPSYKNQPTELREKAVEIANALLQDGAEEGIAIATGLKQARGLLKNHKEKTLKSEIMETNKGKPENDPQSTNQNANSAYSGSGSMQPGGSTGEAGKLNDYPEDETEQDPIKNKQNNPEGKSIAEATDPSKLSDI